MTYTRRKNTVFSIVVAGLSAWAMTAHASGDGSEVSELRVSLSKELALLGQQISSASCRLAAGMDAAYAEQELRTAYITFEAIIDALENGNQSLGVSESEPGEEVLATIASLRDVWEPVKSAAQGIMAGDHSDLSVIAVSNKELLAASRQVSSKISKHYLDPKAKHQGAVQAINFAGRQPLISHTMSMNICGLATGEPAFGTTEALRETVSLYSISLDALNNGMDVAGIQPPPTAEIASELADLAEDWSTVAPWLETFASGEAVSAQDVIKFAYVKDTHAQTMNNVVTLYAKEFGGAGPVYRAALDAYVKVNLALSNSD